MWCEKQVKFYCLKTREQEVCMYVDENHFLWSGNDRVEWGLNVNTQGISFLEMRDREISPLSHSMLGL